MRKTEKILIILICKKQKYHYTSHSEQFNVLLLQYFTQKDTDNKNPRKFLNI